MSGKILDALHQEEFLIGLPNPILGWSTTRLSLLITENEKTSQELSPFSAEIQIKAVGKIIRINESPEEYFPKPIPGTDSGAQLAIQNPGFGIFCEQS